MAKRYSETWTAMALFEMDGFMAKHGRTFYNETDAIEYCKNILEPNPEFECERVHYLKMDDVKMKAVHNFTIYRAGDDVDNDPTPWCSACGAMFVGDCNCGPIADND